MYPAGNETKIEFKMNETETERAKNSEKVEKKCSRFFRALILSKSGIEQHSNTFFLTLPILFIHRFSLLNKHSFEER